VRSLAILAAVSLVAAAPVSAADVTLVGPEGRVALTEAARSQMSAIVKREAESCSISSVGYPDVFPGREGAAEWRASEGRPHLDLRYDTPIVMRLGIRRGSPVLASEVLIGLDDPKFIRQPLTRHDGVVTLHGKCSGHTAIELMCLPALRPYFAETVANSCQLLERKPG
jgi:hypothetical protein